MATVGQLQQRGFESCGTLPSRSVNDVADSADRGVVSTGAGKHPPEAALLRAELQNLWVRCRLLRLRTPRLRCEAEHHSVLAAALRSGGEYAGGTRKTLK